MAKVEIVRKGVHKICTLSKFERVFKDKGYKLVEKEEIPKEEVKEAKEIIEEVKKSKKK